jgi:uncharacterized protein YecE (DUF72 family)
MYDAGTRSEGYLRGYAREFGSVEVDSTFYGTPPPDRVRKWAAQVPPDFTFAFKLPREITHDRRLLASAELVDEFVASAEVLGDQLEGILIQLAPDFAPAELGALEEFVAALPAGPRWALEVRDPAWLEGDVRARLRETLAARQVALAVTDGTFVPLPTMLEELREPTAPHAYVRWLGRRDAVQRFDAVQFDRSAQITQWADAIRAAAPKLTSVSGYANNHYTGHSPAAIRDLYAALGIAHERPTRIEQTSLFE